MEEAVKAATYSVKPAELASDPAWFHEFHKQIASLRFLASGGLIKIALAKLKTDKDGSDDIAEGKDPSGEAGRAFLFGYERPECDFFYMRSV